MFVIPVQEAWKYEASLGYILKSYLKKKSLSKTASFCKLGRGRKTRKQCANYGSGIREGQGGRIR